MSEGDVTDEIAMKALLSSAEARSRERENSSDGHHGGRGRRWADSHPYDHRDSTATNNNKNNKPGHNGTKRSRFSTDHSNKSGTNELSYYGPTDHENRKRSRPDNPHPREGAQVTVPRVEPEDNPKKERTNNNSNVNEEKIEPQYKPNFGLSGALSKDAQSGNMYKGVVLKFKEPPEARAPNTQWRFYVFKRGQKDVIETLHISKQSAYLMGRNADIADIPMHHPSLSSQHAVLQFRALPNAEGRLLCQPYIMDLESTNGTFLNGIQIDAARYYQLKKGDVLTFGASTREYVLLTENTTSASC
jgi:smad nuclear-interacting protein 1